MFIRFDKILNIIEFCCESSLTEHSSKNTIFLLCIQTFSIDFIVVKMLRELKYSAESTLTAYLISADQSFRPDGLIWAKKTRLYWKIMGCIFIVTTNLISILEMFFATHSASAQKSSCAVNRVAHHLSHHQRFSLPPTGFARYFAGCFSFSLVPSTLPSRSFPGHCRWFSKF